MEQYKDPRVSLIREYLRAIYNSFAGYPNDSLTRDDLHRAANAYLQGQVEAGIIRQGVAVCNASNNPPSQVRPKLSAYFKLGLGMEYFEYHLDGDK